MRLENRLDKLEAEFKGVIKPEDKTKQEYERSWRENAPEATVLYSQLEDYCWKSGRTSLDITEWVKLARTDPIAEGILKKYHESYQTYVKNHFGVTTDAVRNTIG